MSDDTSTQLSASSLEGRPAYSLLVVDDDSTIREIMQLMLESVGHRVAVAADGQEAIALLATRAFDLVITDMLMPGADGLELLAAVKKSSPGTRVLVMSGGGMIGVNDYLKVAKKLGAHGVLEKPFTSDSLVSAVAELLAETD